MTNTKFRKRALLSSVAMLLVALIALGSATFAWFVANPQVKATGLAINTKASPGLLIASDSVKTIFSSSPASAFKQDTVLKAEGTTSSYATGAAEDLLPAAPCLTFQGDTAGAKTLKFGTIAAENAARKNLDANASWENASGVWSENIYVKTSTTGDSDVAFVKSAGVKINTVTNPANPARAGIKVALVAHQKGSITYPDPADDTQSITTSAGDVLLGIWKVSEGGSGVTGNDSAVWNGTTGAHVDGTSLAAAPENTYKASAASYTLATPLVVNNSVNGTYVTAYVYLDGENDGVFSENVPDVTSLVDSIDIRFSTGDSVSFT